MEHGNAPAAGQQSDEWVELTDNDRTAAFNSLPNMLDGFLKTWGWLHFAKAIEAKCREKNARATLPAAACAEQGEAADDDGEGPLRSGWQVSIGPGHAGYGVYAHMTEYPEEGAVCLCIIDPNDYPAASLPPPARNGEMSDEDAKDAARYRWLRACGAEWGRLSFLDGRGNLVPEWLDDAIDDEMSASCAPKQTEGNGK